jgi:hypothetical protein
MTRAQALADIHRITLFLLCGLSKVVMIGAVYNWALGVMKTIHLKL